MKIHQIFFKNTLRNFCYLIVFDDGAIYCLDPFNSDEITEFLGETRALSAIINSHDHCDHYSGNSKLVESFQCPVMAHPNAMIPGKTRDLLDHEVIHRFENWSLEVLYTPGHTLSHLCLLLKNGEMPYALFTGDCFFNAGVGNCHNGGDPQVLYRTIDETFSSFPDELLIYPGHEYLKRNLEFTLSVEPENQNAHDFLDKIKDIDLNEIFFINNMKIEREINTFLRLDSKNLRSHLGLENEMRKNVFIKLRELRNNW